MQCEILTVLVWGRGTFRVRLVTKTEIKRKMYKSHSLRLGKGFFRVGLVANTKSETMSMTKIKTNMKHLRRRIFQG